MQRADRIAIIIKKPPAVPEPSTMIVCFRPGGNWLAISQAQGSGRSLGQAAAAIRSTIRWYQQGYDFRVILRSFQLLHFSLVNPMFCKLYFGALLSVALLAEPLIAQTGATVEHVLVRGNADAMEVEIQTSGAIAPNTQAITGPDRIVVDFPGALPSAELRSLMVNRGALKRFAPGCSSRILRLRELCWTWTRRSLIGFRARTMWWW